MYDGMSQNMLKILNFVHKWSQNAGKFTDFCQLNNIILTIYSKNEAE